MYLLDVHVSYIMNIKILDFQLRLKPVLPVTIILLFQLFSCGYYYKYANVYQSSQIVHVSNTHLTLPVNIENLNNYCKNMELCYI